MLYNPTNIDVGPDGRVWAIEAVDYRNFNNPSEEHLSHPEGERVVILEDTDEDGRADTSMVFVQDDDLVAPLGIAVFGNQVLVSASPKIYLYTDTNGDDRADEREVFLSGFGGLDHDHGVHSISAGPGGRWYFTTGNAGPHIVTDASGWTLRSGSIYNGGTPYMEDNQPGLVSDDGHLHPGGLMLQIRPDGTGLRVMAENVLFGFLEAENEENAVLKDPHGREHVVAKNRIEDRAQLEVSLMPGPKELGLSEQQVADLVKFLRNHDQSSAETDR